MDNKPNKTAKFRTKIWDLLNDDTHETYSANTHIIFKSIVLKSSLCDYKDVYIFVKGTISVVNTAGTGHIPNNEDRNVVFKSCTSFKDCISEINNTQVDDAISTDVVKPM